MLKLLALVFVLFAILGFVLVQDAPLLGPFLPIVGMVP